MYVVVVVVVIIIGGGYNLPLVRDWKIASLEYHFHGVFLVFFSGKLVHRSVFLREQQKG